MLPACSPVDSYEDDHICSQAAFAQTIWPSGNQQAAETAAPVAPCPMLPLAPVGPVAPTPAQATTSSCCMVSMQHQGTTTTKALIYILACMHGVLCISPLDTRQHPIPVVPVAPWLPGVPTVNALQAVGTMHTCTSDYRASVHDRMHNDTNDHDACLSKPRPLSTRGSRRFYPSHRIFMHPGQSII